jgi:hypothetical protein
MVVVVGDGVDVRVEEV